MVCAPLGLTAGPIGFSGMDYIHRASPHLSLTGGATSTVAVAVAETPLGASDGVARLRFTGFDAWDTDWPDSLGSGTTSGFVVGVDQFAIDRGVDDDTIAIAYPGLPQPPAPYPNGLFFQQQMNVFSGASPEPFDLLGAPGTQELARFVVMGTTESLVGVRLSPKEAMQDYHEMTFCLQPPDSDNSVCFSNVACGTRPVDADAIVTDQGYLFAISSSRPIGQCFHDEWNIGSPDRVLVGILDGLGGSIVGQSALPVEIQIPDDAVRFVRMIPHSAGAWLLYQYEGLNAEQPPPLMAMLIAEDGTVLLDSTPLLDGDQLSVEPAVAAIGDQLFIAWVDAFDPNGDSHIMMRVYDDEGQELFQDAYARKMVNPRLSALGSPDGAQVLIGWSEQTGADGAGEEQAYVARFTCGYGQI